MVDVLDVARTRYSKGPSAAFAAVVMARLAAHAAVISAIFFMVLISLVSASGAFNEADARASKAVQAFSKLELKRELEAASVV